MKVHNLCFVQKQADGVLYESSAEDEEITHEVECLSPHLL